MKIIEKTLHEHHQQLPLPNPEKPVAQQQSSTQTQQISPALLRAPFAKIDEIFPGSPAEKAGLQLGDMLLVFGHVDGANGGLAAVPRAVSNGAPVRLEVRRAQADVTLTIVPTTWGGRGLLGCHLSPCGP